MKKYLLFCVLTVLCSSAAQAATMRYDGWFGLYAEPLIQPEGESAYYGDPVYIYGEWSFTADLQTIANQDPIQLDYFHTEFNGTTFATDDVVAKAGYNVTYGRRSFILAGYPTRTSFTRDPFERSTEVDDFYLSYYGTGQRQNTYIHFDGSLARSSYNRITGDEHLEVGSGMTVSEVPLPGAVMLLASGLGILGIIRKQKVLT